MRARTVGRTLWLLFFFPALGEFIFGASAALAQMQTNIATPVQGLNNGFFENVGVGFNFSIKGAPGGLGANPRGVVGLGANRQLLPNIQFQQNNAAPNLPFGGGAGANPANFGFNIVGGGFNAGFGITAGQGSTSGISSTTASVTSLNGHPGMISETTQRPFVISVVPVVGGFMPGIIGFDQPGGAMPGVVTQPPEFTSVLQEKLSRLQSGESSGPRNRSAPAAGGSSPAASTTKGHDAIVEKFQAARDSSAGRSTASIREIQRQQAAADEEKQREMHELLSQARAAEAAGKNSVAKGFYQRAAQRADGDQLAEIRSKIRELGTDSKR